MKIYLRTFVKGAGWEILGVIIMAIYCSIRKESYSIIFWYFLIRIALYYPYHRFFKKIKFNKTIEIK